MERETFSNNENTINNSELIYEYTKDRLKDINRSIDVITGKLTAVLGFSSVLLKFAADIPVEGIQFTFKFLVSSCLILAVCFCGSGLLPKASGDSDYLPSVLLDKYYGESEEEMRERIIRQWIVSIQNLKDLRDDRLQYLNYAMYMVILSALLFWLNSVASSIH